MIIIVKNTIDPLDAKKKWTMNVCVCIAQMIDIQLYLICSAVFTHLPISMTWMFSNKGFNEHFLIFVRDNLKQITEYCTNVNSNNKSCIKNV